ncbi:MAG: serine/threonine-protein kinase [Pseudomonadota bacterium]
MEIPGYDIQRELGSGGMATVYLAIQENLHRDVALKVMTPGLAVDETYCQRFLKEGRIAAQLNHLNLLTVYDIGVHENHYYMASEYLPGGTARDKMNEGMTEADILHIITDIAQGLQFAHSKGFVHRDVKPGNLLFRGNGDCVLGDFGIAKAVDSNTGATKLGTSIGTPHYMSPEQAKGEKVDHRTDLYSLGVVFYEMLTGKPPFDADDPFSVALMQINEPCPEVPAEFSHFQPLIEKLMAKDREERYAQADDFLDDLEDVTGAVAPARKTTRRKMSPSEPGRRATPPPASKAAQEPAESTDGKRSMMPMVVGGTAVIAVLTLAIVGWNAMSGGGGEDQPDPDPPTPNPDIVEPTPEPPNREDEQRERFARLIGEAEAFVASGALLCNGGESALARYRAILTEDPDNDSARLKLRELANTIESAAEIEWAKGELQNAYTLLRQASVQFPGDQGIEYLLNEIESQDYELDDPLENSPDGCGATTTLAGGADDEPDNPAPEPEPANSGAADDTPSDPAQPVALDADARARVEALLKQADNYFDANIFSHPPGENAMDKYLEVKAIDPANRRANERLARIAGLWLRAAEVRISRGEWDKARAMVDRGLQAEPDNEALAELLRQIEQNGGG